MAKASPKRLKPSTLTSSCLDLDTFDHGPLLLAAQVALDALRWEEKVIATELGAFRPSRPERAVLAAFEVLKKTLEPYKRTAWIETRDKDQLVSVCDILDMLLNTAAAPLHKETALRLALAIEFWEKLPGAASAQNPPTTTSPDVADDLPIEIEPGGYRLADREEKLPGMPLRILKMLLATDRAVSARQVHDKLYTDSKVEDNTVKSHVVRVRKSLRDALCIDKSKDPIPCLDRGPDLAWKLDRVLLKASLKIPR